MGKYERLEATDQTSNGKNSMILNLIKIYLNTIV